MLKNIKTIANSLTELQAKEYLQEVLFIMYCDKDGNFDREKECGSDEISDLCNLLDPII